MPSVSMLEREAETGRITPVGAKVLIKEHAVPDQLQSGLFVPDIHRKHVAIRTATVIKCGPGYRNPKDGTYTPLAVHPGDEVIVMDCHGEEIEPKKFEYRVVDEELLMAVLEKAA